MKITGTKDKVILAAAKTAERILGLRSDLSVEVVFFGIRKMRELNKSFRGVDGATDVLSFQEMQSAECKVLGSQFSVFGYLGSIAVCKQKIIAQAEEYGHSVEREKAFLFVHGLLHLLGYNHSDTAPLSSNPCSPNSMEALQEQILDSAGYRRPPKTRSGFCAIIGRANVGKSSILNKIIGQKVAIVSPKAQTTRDKIIGIFSDGNMQIVFVDTPGIHQPATKLGEYMLGEAESAARDVDVIVVVLDAGRGVTQRDNEILATYLKRKTPVIIAVNKTDLTDYESLYPALEPLNKLPAADIIPLSALTGFNIDALKNKITQFIPEGPFYYPADEVTDKSLRWLAAEIIREKVLLYLQDEIPHGVQAVIESFDEGVDFCEIHALIVCEKQTHKAIIIGKGGEMLKKIGTSARASLEKLLDKKVNLKTFVKVVEDWRNRPGQLKDLGYRK